MRAHIIAVGRAKPGPERDLYEHFVRRLRPKPELREIPDKGSLPPHEAKQREGEALLAAVPNGAVVLALDEKGKALTSAGMAEKIGNWRDGGVGDLAFLIGGAEGLDGEVKKSADVVVSLGPMTWPHMLVRGLLAEQLFRVQCILSNHPYHRE